MSASSSSLFIPQLNSNSKTPTKQKQLKFSKQFRPNSNFSQTNQEARISAKNSQYTEQDQQLSPHSNAYPQTLVEATKYQLAKIQETFTQSSRKLRVSPASHSTSITSEIPSLDFNSYCDIGSSSSTNGQLLNTPNYSIQSKLASQSISQSYPQKQQIAYRDQPINFSPQMQPYEDPHTYPQSVNGFSCKTPTKGQSKQSMSSYSLANWNLLPLEIQKATQIHKGDVEIIQMNYDAIIPSLSMPHDKNLSMRKVIEAQKLQESLTLSLIDKAKAGCSLQATFLNLVKDFNKSTSNSLNSSVSKQSIASSASPTRFSNNMPVRHKKISKKVPLVLQRHEKSNESCPSSIPIQSAQTTVRSIPKINNNRSQLNYQNNSYNYIPDTIDQEKESSVLVHIPRQQGINYQEINHGNAVHVIEMPNSSKTHMNSPIKNTLSANEAFEEEAINQSELLNSYDNIEVPQSIPYEEDNFGIGESSRHAINFKNDEDDSFCGTYLSQNDTIEDLLNSQNKKTAKQSQQSQQPTSLYHQLSHIGSASIEDVNIKPCNRQGAPQEASASQGIDYYGKQRINNLSSSDMLNSSSRRPEFYHTYDGNYLSFNKVA